MNKNTSHYKLYSEEDLEDNDDYPTDEAMLIDIRQGWAEIEAAERGEIALRSTYVDYPAVSEAVSIEPQSNVRSTARMVGNTQFSTPRCRLKAG